jgi:hypothetical protein
MVWLREAWAWSPRKTVLALPRNKLQREEQEELRELGSKRSYQSQEAKSCLVVSHFINLYTKMMVSTMQIENNQGLDLPRLY